MKANELRIGNLVISPIQGESEINARGIQWQTVKKGYYKPIPLTEEWLIKFGFEYRRLTGYYVKNDFYCFFGDTDETRGKIIFASNFRKRIFIQYVHQLQNIYFALTNEELKEQI